MYSKFVEVKLKFKNFKKSFISFLNSNFIIFQINFLPNYLKFWWIPALKLLYPLISLFCCYLLIRHWSQVSSDPSIQSIFPLQILLLINGNPDLQNAIGNHSFLKPMRGSLIKLYQNFCKILPIKKKIWFYKILKFRCNLTCHRNQLRALMFSLIR